MVVADALSRLSLELLAVGEPAQPLIKLLDPPRRAVVLMTILGLVLLGLTLVACVMIGGRWVRRIAKHNHGRTKKATHIENQRLRDALRPILPQGGAGETTISRPTGDDTIVGN